jgi:hypothetical protein
VSARGRSTDTLDCLSQYNAQWRSFRRLTRCGVGAFFATLIAFVLAGVLGQSYWGRDISGLLLVAAVLSFIALGVFLTIQGNFRCPRCNEYFSKCGLLDRPSVRRRCLNCGLRLYQ